MKYPSHRPRRLRNNAIFRRMIKETRLSPDDLVMPFFVRPGKNVRKAITSMPGICQLSIDNLIKEVREVKKLGIPAVILFGIPDKKDDKALGAYAQDGIIQHAVAEIKQKVPGIAVVTDVCLCAYMSHGHCGIVRTSRGHRGLKSFAIDNDATVDLLAQTALSHAQSGADMVAPSAMMDGQVKSIRTLLDKNKFSHIPIMAYAAKYASSFYGPFRDAVGSPPQYGDRQSYQMDISNAYEAMREIELDVKEGADIIMIKPALLFLDIIRRAKDTFNLPVAAYNVSGEFAMIKSAGRAGMIDEQKAILEVLISIKRAGADIILTYFAKEIAKNL